MSQNAKFVLKSPAHRLDAVGLHDATLAEVHVNLDSASATLCLSIVGGMSATLSFSGLKHIELARKQPWGRSNSVNACRDSGDGIYEVEMQSGDLHRITAEGWEFAVEAGPLPGAV